MNSKHELIKYQTVSQVSRYYSVSTRMLRYYEQIGLLKSDRVEGYSYRVYDETNIQRLRQILFLRKLRLSLQKIKIILENSDASLAIEVFNESIAEIDKETDALNVIRRVFTKLIDELSIAVPLPKLIIDDNMLFALVKTIPPSKTILKEEITMSDINKAEKQLEKLTDVRIVYLPPSTVASSRHYGEEPEGHARIAMQKFVDDTKLWEVKPDMRLYGFNSPNPQSNNPIYGYEYWVTIPEDMEVPEPLEKKYFEGGEYAAHTIKMGNFHQWAWLDAWVRENGVYQYVGNGDPANMFGSLEEHLNAPIHMKNKTEFDHLDLLIHVCKTK